LNQVRQCFDDHAFIVDRRLKNIRTVGKDGGASVGVGRCLDNHEVSWVDEQLGSKIQALHSSARDEQPVRGRALGGCFQVFK